MMDKNAMIDDNTPPEHDEDEVTSLDKQASLREREGHAVRRLASAAESAQERSSQ